jgi:hypothetical protein
VTVPGAEATRTGVAGVLGICGAGEPSAEATDPTEVLAPLGVVAESSWTAAFGVATMSAPAGTLTAGAAPTLTCPLAVLWSWCWWMTRVVKTPSMAIALVNAISRDLFACAQRKFI